MKPSRPMLSPLFLPLVACASACQGGPDDSDTGIAPSAEHGLAIATSDFSAGALATYDPVRGALDDAIVATTGDTVVAADAGVVYQIDRSPPAAVRAWDPGDWSVPLAEYAIPGGSNPQDVARCGGHVVVSLLAEARLATFAPDGTPGPDVDLSPWADDDGRPEAATLVHAGDRLFLGLQELDTSGSIWTPTGPGVVAEIVCGDGGEAVTVGSTWEVGPNPSLHALSDERLIVRTGTWGSADGDVALLDVGTGTLTPIVAEEALQEDVGDLAVVGSVVVMVTAAFDFSHHTVRCVDVANGTRVDGDVVGNFLAGVAPGGDGNAWIAQSIDYANAESPTGVFAVDPATCVTATSPPIPTLLPPYAIASY